MKPVKLVDTTLLEKALDAAALRQQVISNNIANINTSGFRTSTVAFEDELRKAIDAKDDGDFRMVAEEPEHLELDDSSVDSIRPLVHQVDRQVDMNSEMSNLAKNQVVYNAIVGKLSGYLGALKYVIDNSGR